MNCYLDLFYCGQEAHFGAVTETSLLVLHFGWEVGEFRYTPTRWEKPHRFVVVRRPLPDDPVEAKQLTLFTFKRYAYTVLVTNLDLESWRVWRFYSPRATIETNIRELLYDLPMGKIPTTDWVANVAFFHLVLLAFDLAHWFKRLCLPPEYLYATLETLRTDLLVTPARLTRHAGRNVLPSAARLPSPRFVRSCVSTCQPLADTRENVNLQIASDQYLCIFKDICANQRQPTLF